MPRSLRKAGWHDVIGYLCIALCCVPRIYDRAGLLNVMPPLMHIKAVALTVLMPLLALAFPLLVLMNTEHCRFFILLHLLATGAFCWLILASCIQPSLLFRR